MVVKLSNGSGHIFVRIFHLFISYPMHSCFAIFIIYLQIMDIILYFKIRTRGLLDMNIPTMNHTDIFNSLPIKKIMVGQSVSIVFFFIEK
jgi:hypothetical protein